MGYYTKSNIEVCLLATKGEAHKLVKSNAVSQVIVSPKTEHSRKPPEARDKIIELCGNLPRIELFARPNNPKDLWNKNSFEGWDVWGNEVESDITLPT